MLTRIPPTAHSHLAPAWHDPAQRQPPPAQSYQEQELDALRQVRLGRTISKPIPLATRALRARLCVFVCWALG